VAAPAHPLQIAAEGGGAIGGGAGEVSAGAADPTRERSDPPVRLEPDTTVPPSSASRVYGD